MTNNGTKIDKLLAVLTAVSEKLGQISQQLKTAREVPSVPLELKKMAAIEAAQYLKDNFTGFKVYTHRHETVRYAVKLAETQGHFLEFGVHTGGTISQAARMRPKIQFWGFDSFEGPPEDWGGTAKSKGDFDLDGVLPDVPENVSLVKGWFEDTVPEWKAAHKGAIAYCHIDCDLYSSTVTVFKGLEDRFVPGTVLLFDEYFGYPDWKNGEHKAFLEMIERTGFNYDVKAISHMALVAQLK